MISDYVNSNAIIDGLNQVLRDSGYSGEERFCDINGEVADFGIAFISPEKEEELVANGLIYRMQ